MVETTATEVKTRVAMETQYPKAMTLDEIMHHFQEEFMDEVNGSNSYLDAGWSAREMHHYDLARGLFAMGKDEYTHATYIHDYLKQHGVELPEDQQLAWLRLKERIHQLF